MNDAIKQMLERYQCHSLQEHDQALREILQEIVLLGLWRGKFFEQAAFYGVHSSLLKGVHPDTLIRVKVEIDTEPALEYHYEQKFLSQPLSVTIKCVNEETLFACKMYAAFFRTWKGRVKGRDWYDVVWFIRKNSFLNLSFFSKLCGQQENMDRAAFLKMARERIDQLNLSTAIEDVIYFVHDQEAIRRTWSKEFFLYWIERIRM